jgi:4a-hydroxytetrahydrobiopterin dehydratase
VKRKTPRKRPRRAAKAPFPIPPGWSLDTGGKSISLRLETKDFLEAMRMINDLAAVAEEVQHHPDFHLERWNRLRITTWSHDIGGLSDRDEKLAKRMSEVLSRHGYPK